jgi:hypothetical protein
MQVRDGFDSRREIPALRRHLSIIISSGPLELGYLAKIQPMHAWAG